MLIYDLSEGDVSKYKSYRLSRFSDVLFTVEMRNKKWKDEQMKKMMSRK